MRLDCVRALSASALSFLPLIATPHLAAQTDTTGPASSGSGALHGSVFYREKTPLFANAVLEVTLEEVSRQDAPIVIARVRNEKPGNIPIPFVIAYDPARIDPAKKYALSARILVDREIRFYTSTFYPVFAGADDKPVVMLLSRPRGTPAARVATPQTGALENTYWKLTGLGNESITVTERQPEPYLILHSAMHRVIGSGGCNRLSGSYQVDGDGVTLSQMASTRMACADGMETEQRFLAALAKASKWRITGEQLELLDSAGTALAKFAAVYIR